MKNEEKKYIFKALHLAESECLAHLSRASFNEHCLE